MRTKDEIYADMAPLRAELEAIEDLERREKHERLLGKCFKFRNNYGGDCPGWWLYAKVTGMEGWWPRCFSFEETSRNIIEIKRGDHHSLGSEWQEISPKEFRAAWHALQDKIAQFNV